MTASAFALRLRDLGVRYPAAAVDALAGISLELVPGDLVSVVGPAGAGKSTLALVAAGFVPRPVRAALSGQLGHPGGSRPGLLLDRPSSQLTGARATVREEVAFGLENLGVPRAEMDDRIDRVLALLGIEDLAERAPEALSGGEQQRVAIAAILAMAPGLLVADEPTSHLDPAGASQVASLLAVAAAGGTAVLAAGHEPEILGRSSRAILLDGGRVVADGIPGSVLSSAVAQAAGLVPPIVALALAADVDPRLAFDAGAVTEALLVRGGALTIIDARPATGGGWAPVRTHPPGDVEIAGLVHRYPDGRAALRGVDLSIPAGAAVAVVGPNGSGKTTLAKHLNGLLRPTAGSVRVGGLDVAAAPVHENARRIGFAFADPAEMLVARTVQAELEFGPRQFGLPPAEVARLVDVALEAVGLAARRGANPHDLPPGDQRLVGLAAVLATDPAVVVLDEPTPGLDPGAAECVGEIVAALKAAGRTVVAVTHDMDFAARFERIAVLRSGELVLDGPPEVVFSPEHAKLIASAGVRPPIAATIGARLGVEPAPRDVTALLRALADRPTS